MHNLLREIAIQTPPIQKLEYRIRDQSMNEFFVNCHRHVKLMLPLSLVT